MNNDYLDPVNSKGMPSLADSAFAMEFLLRAKNGIRNCAYAIAETATPEVKAMLTNQLQETLALHEEISLLMINRGWLHPYNVLEQLRVDLISADTMLKIADMKLFPDNTSRLGMFADLAH